MSGPSPPGSLCFLRSFLSERQGQEMLKSPGWQSIGQNKFPKLFSLTRYFLDYNFFSSGDSQKGPLMFMRSGGSLRPRTLMGSHLSSYLGFGPGKDPVLSVGWRINNCRRGSWFSALNTPRTEGLKDSGCEVIFLTWNIKTNLLISRSPPVDLQSNQGYRLIALL